MNAECSLVSILIPCYNSESYLTETLDSCLGQSHKNIEIIVVDDGSSDNSLSIAKEYASAHPNVKVFSQENRGAPAARNLAFTHAKGDYIQYLDADDILGRDKLSSQMAALEGEDGNTVVFGPCSMFEDSLDRSVPYDIPVNRSYDDPKKFLLDLWSSATMVLPHTWLVHRSLIERAGPWDETLLKNQDGAFFARVVYNASKVIYEAKALVYYRTHNQASVSRKKAYRSEASRLNSFDVYENLFKDRLDDPEVRKALAVVYSYFIFDNYPLYHDLIEKAREKIGTFGYREPINVNIGLYRKLAPVLGIYGAVRFHKALSRWKRQLGGLIKPRAFNG
jgi:glycosyltransferase involved in cell wall biosynthesis